MEVQAWAGAMLEASAPLIQLSQQWGVIAISAVAGLGVAALYAIAADISHLRFAITFVIVTSFCLAAYCAGSRL